MPVMAAHEVTVRTGMPQGRAYARVQIGPATVIRYNLFDR